jgi:putative ABC transport system permease protein
MLALQEGRYPTRPDEVAVTDGVAATFALDIGAYFAFDGVERTVVGLVENPSDLNVEFALVAPLHDDLPEEVTILVNSTDEEVFPFRAPSGASTTRSRRPDREDVTAAFAVLGNATVIMLLIAFIAAASFIVVAQRRLRQLGMFAGVIGASAGLLGWIAAAPGMESAVGHRIDPFNVPWWLIGTGMLLALVTAIAAAWWPARMVASIPITHALSGRPPKPSPLRRSAVVAGLLIAAGLLSLPFAGQISDWLASIGTAATIAGILLLGPLALRGLAAVAGPFPVAVRLAWRDLARYQARAGATLAAISLALGISSATVITATAAEYTADKGNLADNQLLIRTGTAVEGESGNITGPFVPERTPEERERLDGQVEQIASLLGNAAVLPLDVALDPTMEPDAYYGGRPVITLAEWRDSGGVTGYGDITLLYTATPELLDYYGIDLEAVDPAMEVLTVETGEIWFIGASREPGTQPELVTNLDQIASSYTSLPGSFVTPDALRRRGWEQVRIGWIVETDESLTSEQLAAARTTAADAGLTIESRDHQENLASLRMQAIVNGMLLALGILALTIGLIRSEAAGDLRTLTATGATSRVRRTITAATAGALAGLGALLGTIGAYLTLYPGYAGDISVLSRVPIFHLLLIVVGIPLVVVSAGWLLAGREPPALARRPIE